MTKNIRNTHDDREDFITHTGVIERGWTNGMIQKYISPSKTKSNHHNPKQQIKLYLLDDVMEFEDIPEIANKIKINIERRKAAQIKKDNKWHEIVKRVDGMPISITPFTIEFLLQETFERDYGWDWNYYINSRGRFPRMASYLMYHELTKYGRIDFGSTNVDDGYCAFVRFRSRIKDSLMRAYLWLEDKHFY